MGCFLSFTVSALWLKHGQEKNYGQNASGQNDGHIASDASAEDHGALEERSGENGLEIVQKAALGDPDPAGERQGRTADVQGRLEGNDLKQRRPAESQRPIDPERSRVHGQNP